METQDQPQEPQTPEGFSWEASEFVHHAKPASWYVILVSIVIVASAVLVYFQQWMSIALAVVMMLAIIVYTRKEPRTLQYTIDEQGISIGGKLSPYPLFRSFSVHPEVGWHEIDLEPAKRFAPRLTLIAEAEAFEQIEAILAQHLPRQDREYDLIERLAKYVKF